MILLLLVASTKTTLWQVGWTLRVLDGFTHMSGAVLGTNCHLEHFSSMAVPEWLDILHSDWFTPQQLSQETQVESACPFLA